MLEVDREVLEVEVLVLEVEEVEIEREVLDEVEEVETLVLELVLEVEVVVVRFVPLNKSEISVEDRALLKIAMSSRITLLSATPSAPGILPKVKAPEVSAKFPLEDVIVAKEPSK